MKYIDPTLHLHRVSDSVGTFGGRPDASARRASGAIYPDDPGDPIRVYYKVYLGPRLGDDLEGGRHPVVDRYLNVYKGTTTILRTDLHDGDVRFIQTIYYYSNRRALHPKTGNPGLFDRGPAIEQFLKSGVAWDMEPLADKVKDFFEDYSADEYRLVRSIYLYDFMGPVSIDNRIAYRMQWAADIELKPMKA